MKQGEKANTQKTVCGVGYNNMPFGWAKLNEENGRIYQVWSSMIKRCYSEKSLAHSPAYAKCIVCDEWLLLSNFVKDVKELDGYDKWLENKGKYALDKDIKIGRENIYSPKHCSFVTHEENTRERNSSGQFSVSPNPIVAFNEDTGEIISFKTMRDVERHDGEFSRGGVKHALDNGFKKYKGYRWFRESNYQEYINKTLGVINCREVRQRLIESLKEELLLLPTEPKLVIVQVEGDKASDVYVRNKEKLCGELGIKSEIIKLKSSIRQEEVESIVSSLSLDEEVHGIMLQLPIPQSLDAQKIIDLIPYYKDVDALSTYSQGLMFTGQIDKGMQPCTPQGVMYLLQHLEYDVTGKNICVIGRSQLFGKSMAQLLEQKNATVTLCHSYTNNLRDITKNSDCVIVGIGQPKMIDSSYFNGNTSVVIDVGMSFVDGKLVGDVDTDSIMGCVKHFTKTPNGTGQLTVPLLLSNTIKAYKIQKQA